MNNRASIFLGLGAAVTGLLVALVPLVIFPACTMQTETLAGGFVPMKCFWSGRAEVGIGAVIFIGGIFSAFFRSRETRRGVASMLIPISLLGLAVPLFLIGGCAMETMACRISTFPALYVLHSIAIAISAVHLILLRGRVKADGI